MIGLIVEKKIMVVASFCFSLSNTAIYMVRL